MTNNLFRFVSIRPPKVFDEEWIISENKVQAQVVADVSKAKAALKKANKQSSKQQLLAEVGAQYQQSLQYYTNDKLFKIIRSLWPGINELVTRHYEELNYAKFVSALAQLVTSLTFKPKVSSALRDPLVKSLLQSLWLSYYACMMNFTSRPSDREEIAHWIKLFHLFAHADTVEELKKALAKWSTMRLSFPYDIFIEPNELQTADQAEKDKQAIEKKRQAERSVYSSKLSELQTLERLLEDVIANKTKKFNSFVHQVKVTVPAKGKTASSVASFADLKADYMSVVPWKITDKDLIKNNQLQQLLQKYRLLPLDGNAYSLIDTVRRLIAEVIADLDAFDEKQTVITAGNIFQSKRS
ncbi:MAG TPA: hypothetical protein VF487_06065 [Chitinophagaceae bacterium]